MPLFIVRLAAPTWYQPDHPRGQRQVTALEVNADDVNAATVHAYRVLVGEVKVVSVELVADKTLLRPPPLVEEVEDVLIVADTRVRA